MLSSGGGCVDVVVVEEEAEEEAEDEEAEDEEEEDVGLDEESEEFVRCSFEGWSLVAKVGWKDGESVRARADVEAERDSASKPGSCPIPRCMHQSEAMIMPVVVRPRPI
jgi:hypothetical protein